MKLAIANS